MTGLQPWVPADSLKASKPASFPPHPRGYDAVADREANSEGPTQATSEFGTMSSAD